MSTVTESLMVFIDCAPFVVHGRVVVSFVVLLSISKLLSRILAQVLKGTTLT